MGFGVPECWVNGLIVLTINLKRDHILCQTQCSIIPQLHYFHSVKLFSISPGPSLRYHLRPQKINYIFIKL